VVYAPLSTVSPRDFYRQISILLCHTASYNKVQLFHNIQQAIIELAVKKKQIPIIILDDAHFLKTENFFELQLLSNFNFDSLSPVLFILVSQPHLIDAVYQRIKIHIPIEPLSLDQTRQLLAHTLCTCGRNSADLGQLFDQQAIETIHSLSNGIQRKIVNIVDKVLMYGAANQLQTITTEAVYSISAEL
jgi:general secretion pathway protein A